MTFNLRYIYVEVKLVLNGSGISYGVTGHTPTQWNNGSQSVIVPLHPGDRVWMEYQGVDNSIYGGAWSTPFIIKEAVLYVHVVHTGL